MVRYKCLPFLFCLFLAMSALTAGAIERDLPIRMAAAEEIPPPDDKTRAPKADPIKATPEELATPSESSRRKLPRATLLPIAPAPRGVVESAPGGEFSADMPIVVDDPLPYGMGGPNCASRMGSPDIGLDDGLQLLPDHYIYPAYLAGRESRLGSVGHYDMDMGWLWDVTLGGRAAIARLGPADRPEGIQLDIEGATFLRLDPEEDRDLVTADFRFGVPLSFGAGPFRLKVAYYHLSSHLGDEFLLKNPGVTRLNYVRDAAVLGASYYIHDDFRLYSELDYAFNTDGGAGRWEASAGAEFSPQRWTQMFSSVGMIDPRDAVGGRRGVDGAPFLAVHGNFREEVDWSGSLTAQAGWQWVNRENGHRFRLGVNYFNGKADLRQFFMTHEEQIGVGAWYDF